jgi:CHAT domain-containing protein
MEQSGGKNMGLAFLSACETARGDEKIPDEALHLAATPLSAGYRSVVATMWYVLID